MQIFPRNLERGMEDENQETSKKNTHGKMWRRKEESNDVEEIKISNIGKVSKDNNEHNRGINKDDILSDEKKMEI